MDMHAGGVSSAPFSLASAHFQTGSEVFDVVTVASLEKRVMGSRFVGVIGHGVVVVGAACRMTGHFALERWGRLANVARFFRRRFRLSFLMRHAENRWRCGAVR
ncbi:hypothetical protein ACMAUO_07970 [Gluconacetobacter sp. Hr-1-5]|uniref:hypothetical protein n=1 Tax=Gluconacetobacter sp. Hr-1-5 TaxID=3395370 RepID=UPI003B529B6C